MQCVARLTHPVDPSAGRCPHVTLSLCHLVTKRRSRAHEWRFLAAVSAGVSAISIGSLVPELHAGRCRRAWCLVLGQSLPRVCSAAGRHVRDACVAIVAASHGDTCWSVRAIGVVCRPRSGIRGRVVRLTNWPAFCPHHGALILGFADRTGRTGRSPTAPRARRILRDDALYAGIGLMLVGSGG